MTNYISSSKSMVKVSKNNNFSKFFISLTLLIVLFTSFFGTAFVSYVTYEKPVVEKAEAFDPVNWFFCLWSEDSIPRIMYDATQTSNLEYNLFSKSSLNSGISKVDGGWNSVFSLFGYDFLKTNESILGTSLEKGKGSQDEPAEKAEFNAGPKANVFDRFGMAGLNFTSYAGEWKYFVVDPCSKEDPKDPKAGLFYEQRLEPRSTWEETGNSKDVRSQQFQKGFFSAFGSAYNNSVANFFFGFTKFFVLFGIVLINFAFSDIVSVLGINELIAGNGAGSSSLFKTLYDSIFLPLAFMMFTITGIYLIRKAIMQREFRASFGIIVKSVALFVVAIIAGLFPLQFIELPNNIAVVSQSIIISAMGGSLTDNKGLCNTDKGTTEIIKNNDGSLDYKKNQDLLSAASENMRSIIACQLWQNFVFKPWTEGQFGTDYNNLWAKGFAPKGGKELDNDNNSWVGDAAVPMGDGKVINNWALFQLSTQTNAHSPIEKPNEVDKTSMGVARDWWRIVDALSNYDEEETTETPISSEDPDITTSDISYAKVKDTKVSPYWDTWVGNNSIARVWIALYSLLIAVIGMFVPFLFALLSSVTAIGISLLMALAPVMFLLGIYQPQGWNIFASWAQEVLNLTITRIVYGFLLVLSLIFTTAAIKVMNDVGWLQGLLLIIVFSIVLWKFKDTIINSFAAVSFAVSNSSFKQTGEKLKAITKGGAKVATGAAAGGVASKKNGGSVRSGVFKGARTELKQQMYRSNSGFSRSALIEYEKRKGRGSDTILEGLGEDGELFCDMCGSTIRGDATSVGRQPDGTIICQNCLDEGVADKGTREVYDSFSHEEDKTAIQKEMDDRHEAHRTPKSNVDTDEGGFNESVDKSYVQYSDSKHFTDKERQDELIRLLAGDLTDKQTSMDIDYVEIPSILAPYFKGENVKEAIKKAWLNNDYTFIQEMYAAALTQFMQDSSQGQTDANYDSLLEKLKKETFAQYEVRSRDLEGRKISKDNVDVYTVNGEKRYAGKDSERYTSDYDRQILKEKSLQKLLAEREKLLSANEDFTANSLSLDFAKGLEYKKTLENIAKVAEDHLKNSVYDTKTVYSNRASLAAVEASVRADIAAIKAANFIKK